ncbi:MAG: hypothetical protein GXO15_03285 [Crenarchaeota archaeon]|nr:hypothetical protein [Thermoproteota archaeon]
MARRRLWFDERRLEAFARRGRERWRDFEVERIVQRRSKQELYIKVQGVNVKLIVYSDGRVRAYGGRGRLDYAVKRLAERVLGVGGGAGREKGEGAPEAANRRRHGGSLGSP